MPKAIQEVKRLSAETNFFADNEIYGESAQDILTETKKPFRALLELPRNWWSSHSTIGANNKLKKLDLFKINPGKIDLHKLPKPANWNIADGDYIYEMSENEERQIYSIEERRKLEKIYFGVALFLASLITLLFSYAASSIKNF